MNFPILVWPFYDAPEELRRLSPHGGDEDWLAFVPADQETPAWLAEGTPFGVCDVAEIPVKNGRVFIGAHA